MAINLTVEENSTLSLALIEYKKKCAEEKRDYHLEVAEALIQKLLKANVLR